MKGDYEKERNIALRVDWIKLFEDKTCDEQYNTLVDHLQLIRKNVFNKRKLAGEEILTKGGSMIKPRNWYQGKKTCLRRLHEWREVKITRDRR